MEEQKRSRKRIESSVKNKQKKVRGYIKRERG